MCIVCIGLAYTLGCVLCVCGGVCGCVGVCVQILQLYLSCPGSKKKLLGRDGLWASFISGGLYRYISYPSSGRAIGAPGAWTRQEVHTKVVQVVHFVFQKNTKLPI